MIQIYANNNTNYYNNGDCVVFPKSCIIQAELNGAWEMELEHPIDDEGRWKHIVEGAVIAAPSFVSEKQLFRIYSKVKNDEYVTAYARPIFFDSSHDVFIVDKRPNLKNGQQALDILMSGTKYSGSSNIKKVATAYYVHKNLIEAINSSDDNSFLNRWGGEVIYNNYTIVVNERIGGDYGVQILYGKNLSYIEETVSVDEIVTRIIPSSFNGYTLEGDAPWVDSPNINTYPIVYAKKIEFDDVKLTQDCSEDEKGFDTLEELREELVKRCNQMFEEGCDTPDVNLVVEMVDLAQTDEYKGYKILETVSLGDTVHCKNSKIDIVSDARVIRLTWDCIRNIPEEIELGNFEYKYFDELTSALTSVDSSIKKDGTIMADKVAGILDAMYVQLKYQKNVAQKQEVRAILFEDTDPESEMYGALSIGTQGIQIAHKRTADGKTWDWTTALTAKGGYADALITGILSDKTGRNFWNLDSGEFSLSPADGEHGISMNSDGELTINATHITTGTLAGWIIDTLNKKITSQNGSIILDAKNNKITTKNNASGQKTEISPGAFKTGNATVEGVLDASFGTVGSNNASYLKIGNTFSGEKSEIKMNGKFFASEEKVQLFGMSHVSSGGHLVFDSDGSTLAYLASSSKRYKDHVKEIDLEVAEGLYNLPVVEFKYKDGYLAEGDRMTGQAIPGFYAEDMEKCYTPGVKYAKGIPEDWQERTVIPAVVKLLQSQHERINFLETQLKKENQT